MTTEVASSNCTCTHENQHFEVPFKVECCDYDEVECHARLLATRIFRHHTQIHQILERYEPLIRKRWIKKGRQQKMSVLLAASPRIPKHHRPDVDAMHRPKHTKDDTFRINQWEDHFLLPSVNLEDLCISKNLLLFMHSRGRHRPGRFATEDFKSVHTGLEVTTLVVPHVHDHIMILDGADPHSYGRLRDCGDDNAMFDQMRAGQGTLAGVGILVMAIQERKLSFLLRCAKIILHDIQVQDLSVPLTDNPGEVILANDGSQYASLSTEILEAPYRLPPAHDISRIRSFVYAKRAEYEDEIWTLREDPSYFKEMIWEWGEHRRERIRTETGAVYPLLEKEDWWEAVIRTMIADTYTSYHCWDCLSRHVEGLVEIKAAHGEQFFEHGKLPKDYQDAVNYLEWLVNQAMLRPVQKWREGVAASPPLRQHFLYDLKAAEGYPKVPWDKEKDKFLWLIELLLFEDPSEYGMGNLMDALQWTISINDHNRRRLSSWVASLLSELSLLGELGRQVSLLNERPLWAQRVGEEKDRKKLFKAQLDKETVAVERLYWIFGRDLNLAPLAIPLDRYNYPVHKRRTALTTRTMQEAEKELDAFWTHVDAQCFKHVGQTLHELFDGSLGERELSWTPDWVEPEANQLPPKQELLFDIPLENRFAAALELEHNNEKSVGRDTQSTPKAKIKTRGVPAALPPENAGILHEPDQALVVPKMAVSKRALKVFSALFFDDKQEASSGEIPWTEFLHAMASVGFNVQKLNGSAWMFSPTDDYFQRSFMFHEPHPLPKIPYHIARRLGGRLNRAYSWTSETFERA